MYRIELIHMIFIEYRETGITILYLFFPNFPMKKLSELKWKQFNLINLIIWQETQMVL